MLDTNDRTVKHKLGLVNLADELGSLSQACKMIGVSRAAFYRYKGALDDGGIESLIDPNLRVANPKNRVDPQIKSAIVAQAIEQAAQGRVSNELRKNGVVVSPSGVRSVWICNDLANFKQRLKAPEVKVAGQEPWY